jgi:hypothetical protein
MTSYLDITRYTIVQDVSAASEGIKDEPLIFSAVYYFDYPEKTDADGALSYLSVPLVRNNEVHPSMASYLDDRPSTSRYSDLHSQTDTRALVYSGCQC